MEFILQAILFLVAVLWCFYLPGRFFSKRLNFELNSLEDLFFSTTLGVIIFTSVSYLLAWFNLSILLLPILSIFSLITLLNKEWRPFKILKEDIKPLLFISLLAIVFSLTVVLSGEYGGTIRLLGSNGDGVWHIALINELKTTFPPQHPGLSGISFKGYHFFYDFLLAQISKNFNISPVSLYFQFFPVLTAFLWVLGVYNLVLKWSKNRITSLLAVFFTLFGGSFSFVLLLQGHKGFSLDDAFGITQPATSLVNPPFAISIVIITASLFTIYKILETQKNNWLIPLVLLVGLSTLFKIYAGILLTGAFLLVGLYQLFYKKWVWLVALAGLGIIFLTTYWVFADKSASLIYAPLWAPRKVLLDHLPWYGYEEKAYTYRKLSVIRGIIKTELYGLYVFIIGSLGTRILGLFILLFLFVKKFKLPSFFSLIVFSMTSASILIPLLFIQSVQVFDIIQMAWYFLFFTSIFASFGFSALFNFKFNKLFKIILAVILLVATLPSALDKYQSYLSLSKAIHYEKPYYQSLQFLKNQGSYTNVVLEMPKETTNQSEEDLNKWYHSRPYDDSLRIVAFGNKRGFLNRELGAFSNIDISPKISLIKKILEMEENYKITKNSESWQNQLKMDLVENNITFIYSYVPLKSFESSEVAEKIFQNQAAVIYRVN